MSPDFLEVLRAQLRTDRQLAIQIKVTPSAPRSEIFSQLSDGTLKVRLQAPPENGKANKALIKLLKKELNADAEIVSGALSQKKLVRLF